MKPTIDELKSKITEAEAMIEIQEKFLKNCNSQLMKNPHKGLMSEQKKIIEERIQSLQRELNKYKRELKGRIHN